MHMLPRGFVKVRYYGLLASRNKKTKLALCQKLTRTLSYQPVFEGLSTLEIACLLAGRDVTACPKRQKGKLEMVRILDFQGIHFDGLRNQIARIPARIGGGGNCI